MADLPVTTSEREVDLADIAGRFAAWLRSAGLPATPERAGRFARCVTLVEPVRTSELYWLARTNFVCDPAQVPVFDAVFDQVFRGLVDDAARGDANQPSLAAAAPPDTARGRDLPPSGETDRAGGARPGFDGTPGTTDGRGDDSSDAVPLGLGDVQERLGHKDFAACSPEELLRLSAWIAALELHRPVRGGRRTERDRHGRELDVRATLRAAHRTGGDPVRRLRRRRRERHRRIVLLADVSGSMEPYGRAYLWLVHGAVRAAAAEAFVFSTRLTRVTAALRERSPDLAVALATAAAPDWSGGTRIGESIGEFLDNWGRRGMARGAVVIVVSDGWETGDVAVLGEQMGRLSRLAHRVVWVNPRVQRPEYRPLVGGMASALPYVDDLVSGHSLDAMGALLEVLGTHRPAGASARIRP